MTNGMLWNIHKISRYGDTFMILDNNVLKFNGDLAIEKVNVSIHHIYTCQLMLIDWVNDTIVANHQFQIRIQQIPFSNDNDCREWANAYLCACMAASWRIKKKTRLLLHININERLCQEQVVARLHSRKAQIHFRFAVFSSSSSSSSSASALRCDLTLINIDVRMLSSFVHRHTHTYRYARFVLFRSFIHQWWLHVNT